MPDVRNSGTTNNEEELLLPFEKERLQGDYRHYYAIKRHNFRATIDGFSDLWQCFQLLDEIWPREFNDLERQREPKQMLPLLLFAGAHAQFRIAYELAFCCCIGEAWNTLRSAIESVAHAHKTLREPNLIRVWVEKDDGSTQRKEFEKHFLHDKKQNLFPREHGFEKLHEYWSQYSEWGTHTTVSNLARRFRQETTPTDVNWRIEYFEADPQRLATSLFSLLAASSLMERAFFNAFDTRLRLDHVLADMRSRFEQKKESTRKDIIRKFKIQPPAIWP